MLRKLWVLWFWLGLLILVGICEAIEGWVRGPQKVHDIYGEPLRKEVTAEDYKEWQAEAARLAARSPAPSPSPAPPAAVAEHTEDTKSAPSKEAIEHFKATAQPVLQRLKVLQARADAGVAAEEFHSGLLPVIDALSALADPPNDDAATVVKKLKTAQEDFNNLDKSLSAYDQMGKVIDRLRSAGGGTAGPEEQREKYLARVIAPLVRLAKSDVADAEAALTKLQ